MGPTPTPTPIRMRLSCNFVNMYTIGYRVQYTFTRVHARIPNGHPREEKRPRVGQVGGQVGQYRRACPPEDAVSVSVSVPWNLSFTEPTHTAKKLRCTACTRFLQ